MRTIINVFFLSVFYMLHTFLLQQKELAQQAFSAKSKTSYSDVRNLYLFHAPKCGHTKIWCLCNTHVHSMVLNNAIMQNKNYEHLMHLFETQINTHL